jgi:hypothetical protein
VYFKRLRVAAERAADRPGRLVERPGDDPAVFPFDVARLHRAAESPERGIGLCDQDETGRIAVEPMDEPRAHAFARQRGDMPEQRVDERPIDGAVRRMRHHPGRLVDDQHVVVFVRDVECDRFGFHFELLRRRDRIVEPVARFEQRARFAGRAVDGRGAGS